MHKFERDLVTSLKPLDNDKIIYTFFVDLAFGSYELENPSINLWDEDITFVRGNYVVFSPERFESGWDGSPMLKNWNRLKTEYALKEIKTLPENWRLYRID